ncbi:MaoC/PaaZ C-terminal domain-containing protein [Pajaroellobacter abortibovis]|uniref:Uncharacterized protein n=1 Tax=Pajaroellobacter abortibovis TaxID=1882918 RepID=A0A1L6MY79_9BACT|nr:MaoC/PaaZ C-terminal domain-containing protein [Pajaroellobacter abortibovis]APS00462.1 hypothetical protein BCY86_07070 [Pajaroellobacter abortibovis]
MPFDLGLVGKPMDPVRMEYDWKDTVLYALGIGSKKDELDYLYEKRGPKVYPSFAVVPKFQPMMNLLQRGGATWENIIHAGEAVRIHRPFAAAGILWTTATIRALYNMKKFAKLVVDTLTTDDRGEPLAITTSSILLRGEGGLGEPPPKEEKKASIPKNKQPDFHVEESVSPEQALLYRLVGDLNPLHIDPEFAGAAGFEKGPILHGLCTFGYIVRHIAKGMFRGDATKIVKVEGLFRKPVWPGDTLVTQGWRVEPGIIALQISVKETREAVLGGAHAVVAEEGSDELFC